MPLGNITDEYIFFDGRRIARRDSSGNVDYYLADQLGSARVVTNSSGSILDDCDFLPFGDEECVSSSSGNIYKFTGKERDSESGNDYFGARYYTDTLGRFLSPDPGNAGSDPSNPQSWNAYSYARNDPATVTDPTGLASCSQDSAGGWHGGAGCWDAGPSGESNREAANASAVALLGQRAQQQALTQRLTNAQDAARHNHNLAPHSGETFCNIATCQIAKAVGAPMGALTNPKNGQPALANQIAASLARSGSGYKQVSPREAQHLANEGKLVIAVQPHFGHGHVATVRPGGSGRDPLINNIGAHVNIVPASRAFYSRPQVKYYTPQ